MKLDKDFYTTTEVVKILNLKYADLKDYLSIPFLRPIPFISLKDKPRLIWRRVDVLLAQKIKELIAAGYKKEGITVDIKAMGLRKFLSVPKRGEV